MLQNLDKLVRDLTPIIILLAPLITPLAAYLTAKGVKAQKSRKRRQSLTHK